jgi:hypothetical protein
VLSTRPSLPWHDDPPTEQQLEALRRRGYDLSQLDLTRGEACHLLNQATPRQRQPLTQRGLWSDGMTVEQARAAIDQLARVEGWAL